MKPTPAKDLYKKTAQKLNLPEDYVRDVVEYFYACNKSKMHDISYVIFNITGLGRFIIKPLLFFKRELKLFDLIEHYKDRRDNRGIMIRKELEARYENFRKIKPEVEKYHEYVIKQRYGRKIKKDLDKSKKNI